MNKFIFVFACMLLFSGIGCAALAKAASLAADPVKPVYATPVLYLSACSDLAVRIADVHMAENSTVFRDFNFYNNSATSFNIDEVAGMYNSPYIHAAAYHTFGEVKPNGMRGLRMRIDSLNVGGDTAEVAAVRVKGYFADGASCEVAEYFNVYIADSGPSCSELSLNISDVVIGEQSDVIFTFDLKNNSGSGFKVKKILVQENSPYFSASNITLPEFTVGAHDSAGIQVGVNSAAVTDNVSGTATVRIEGEFSGGGACPSLEKSFTVFVRDIKPKPSCSSLTLGSVAIAVNENTGNNQFSIPLNNSSGNRFTVSSFNAYDDSAYFSASARGLAYNEIAPSSTISLPISIEAHAVSADSNGTAYIDLRGNFDDGTSCSIAKMPFTVMVRNMQEYPSCRDIKINAQTVYVEENSTSYETFSLKDNSPKPFYIDKVDAYDYDEDFTVYDYSHDSYAHAGGSADLKVKINSYDVADDKSGSAYLNVSGHFSDGTSCSSNEIGTASFTVNVGDNEELPACSELDFRTNTVYIDEDSTEYATFAIKNHSQRRFYITDFEAYDNDSHFSVYDYSHESYANAGGEADIGLKINAYSVSGDERGTGYFRVSGYFSEGKSCSFSDIGTESFAVVVKDNGGSQRCSGIELMLKNMSMEENSTEYESFSIRNDSGERFYIDSVSVSDDSSYFSASHYTHSSSIAAGSSGEIRLKIKSSSVREEERGRVTLKVAGHFGLGSYRDSGNYCSYQDITDYFYVTVGGSPQPPEPLEPQAGRLEMRLDKASVILSPGKSEKLSITFSNKGNDWCCITLGTSISSSALTASLEDDYFCINAEGERIIDVTVSAGSAASGGSYSVSFKAQHGSLTELKTLNVIVKASTPTNGPGNGVNGSELFISSYPSVINAQAGGETEVAVTIQNTGSRMLEGLTINLMGLPHGISFEPVHHARLSAGQSITLSGKMQIDADVQGHTLLLLEVEASGLRQVREVDLNIATGTTTAQGPLTLMGITSSVTAGLVMLIVVLVIVIVIVSIVKKH